MVRNPFRYLQYVPPEDFVGRWPLVEAIAQDLTSENGDSHAIIAGQRCGKSSILEALTYQLRQPTIMGTGDILALPIYIDFKAGSFNSAETVFAFILNRIYRQINTVVRQHPLDLWSIPLRLGARWFEKLVSAPTLSMHDFEDGLSYILDQLDTPKRPARLVIMLDDISKSFDQPWTEDLYSQARALICSSDLRTRIRLVLTGSQRFLEQRNIYSAPLCDVVRLHYLEGFEPADIAKLIEKEGGLQAPTAEALWRQSGGHPFLAQYLLHHLWEEVGPQGIKSAEAALIDRLASGFLHKRMFELEGWSQVIDTTGMAAYQVLSAASDWVPEEKILAAVQAPAQSVKRSLLGLCCHGLALHNEDWTHYKYTGELFRTWFNKWGITHNAPEQNIQQPDASLKGAQVNITIDTGGGSYIAGSVNTSGGGFIGHDKIIHDKIIQDKDISALLASELVYE